MFCALKS